MDLIHNQKRLTSPRVFCHGVRYLRYILRSGEVHTLYEVRGDSVPGERPEYIKLEDEEGDRIFDEEVTPNVHL